MAERTYGIPDSALTPSIGWSLPALRRAWNQAKGEAAPWWRERSKEAYNSGLDGLARGLKNWSESRNGKRAGRHVGFPRLKTRRRATPSVRFTTGAIRVEPTRHHVTLPRLGQIKTHESTRKLARRIEAGTTRILSATTRMEGGRWFCSFTVEVQRAERTPTRPDRVIGVDVGVKHLAVLSDGSTVDNPRHYDTARRKLAALSGTVSRRQGPDHRAGQRPSNRWQRANRARNRVHHRVSYLRRDGLHKLTTSLANKYGTVVVEDLNVTGMLAQPAARQAHRRRRVRGDPQTTGLQDHLARRAARGS